MHMTPPHRTWATGNTGTTQRNAATSTVSVSAVPPNTRQSSTRPPAPTKPPYDDTTISTKGTRFSVMDWPLTGPMISYCPPWLPPHQKCWYITNVDLNLRRSQHQKSYITEHAATQYYRQNSTQYGVDLPTSTTTDTSYLAPPAPTASEKNLLRPP